MNEQPGRFLRRVWDTVRQPASVSAARSADHVIELCDALLSERGEVSSARIASEAIAAYRQLNESGRGAFFSKLAERFPADLADVDRAIDAYRADPSPDRLAGVHHASEPHRQELFRRWIHICHVVLQQTLTLRASERSRIRLPDSAQVIAIRDISHF